MNEVPPLEVLDGDGSSLRFTAIGRTAHELTYCLAVDVGWAKASGEVSTYLHGPPTNFFADIAQSWRGWDGAKTWEDLEHRVGFKATSDKTGHITLRVTLRDANYTGRVELPLSFEAGALDALSRRVASFFEVAQPNTSLERKRER